MSTHNDGGPAFPRLYSRSDEDGTHGMSLRDWFAGQVVGHLVSNPNQNPDWIRTATAGEQAQVYAFNAYLIADAMLAARERKDGE